METSRGFVQRIEIGRGGLTSVTLILPDSSTAVFVIHDLDSDPERFNERLSKLAVLRDAMDRAEPVEIEHQPGDGGETIERAARISRDTLDPTLEIDQLVGLVMGLTVTMDNNVSTGGESPDYAAVELLDDTFNGYSLILDLQAPERLVVTEQLEMLREAFRTSSVVHLIVDKAGGGKGHELGIGRQRIYAVAMSYGANEFGGDRALEVSGFVESLGFIVPGTARIGMAMVRFTTAPNFSGPGGVVGLVPFTPKALKLMVAQNSPSYGLFEAGLRDNLRMRVKFLPDTPASDTRPAGNETNTINPAETRTTAGNRMVEALLYRRTLDMSRGTATAPVLSEGGDITIQPQEETGLVLAAELLAEEASASRPVWIKVSRETLDHGPEGFPCTPGVPTSDLSPLTLRDLHIPYPAVWSGWGCFNRGIYRFQFKLPTEFELLVDGKRLCLHESTDPGIKLAHACLCGEHQVVVKIMDWMCKYEFVMDVYQLR